MGLALYWLIARLFFSSDTGTVYLNSQLGWNNGIKAGLYHSFSAVWSTLTKTPPYYTGFYGIVSLLLLSSAIYRGRKDQWFQKKKGGLLLFFLAMIFLMLTPYVFIFFYGGQLADRMQLVLPFSQGCMLYLSVEYLFGGRSGEKDSEKSDFAWKKRARAGIAIMLTLAVLKNTLMDMGVCNRIYYTDEWSYQYDKQLAHDIYIGLKDYLAEEGYDETLYNNLIFLGYPLLPYNNAALKGDVAGNSIFAYDIERDDTSRPRILYFMKAVGYPLEPEPYFGEGARAAYYVYFDKHFGDRVDAMPSFPAQGSIQYLESEEIGLRYLVVKLGPYWRSAIDNPANHGPIQDTN